MEVEVGVPRGVSHLMGVVVTGAPEDVSLCSAHVTFVGDLMPCLNGSKASTQPLSNGLLLDLGRVCRVEQQLVDEHVDVDIIKVKVAFLPVNPDASTLQFTADVLYDGTAQELAAVSPVIPIDANISLGVSNGNPIVTGGVFNDSVISVKETSTAIFNITIPVGQSIPLRAVLSTSPAEGRSSFLLSNVRIVYAGRNVECSLPAAEVALANGGMAVSGSYFDDEVDIISLDFGIITNTEERAY
ncbi:uncharacterized protein LOC119573532 [Penaeus monodon]|uniref:uncharacterized protein LOC119573532 n=1 Tax=Penaeus monodon TaxID=6687 RepID=UPI0018A752CC|nr:uncharacterized protein LOC119573532 [Penaeus monodon]